MAQYLKTLTLTPTILNGQTKWDLTVDATGRHGTLGGYPVLDIGANSPATWIQITIDNSNSPVPWNFSKDPLWVNQGPNDPTGPSTSPLISGISTTKGDTVLSFLDSNSGDPVDLHYTLNMVSGTRTSSTLDPIIRNGGCCHVGVAPNTVSFQTTTFIAYLALAFLAGALLTLAVRWMMNRGFQNPTRGG